MNYALAWLVIAFLLGFVVGVSVGALITLRLFDTAH